MMVTIPIWVFAVMALGIVVQLAVARQIIRKSQEHWHLYLVAKRGLLRASRILSESGRGRVSEDVLVLVEDAIDTGLGDVEAELAALAEAETGQTKKTRRISA